MTRTTPKKGNYNDYNNRPHKSLEMETVLEGMWYAMTINMKDLKGDLRKDYDNYIRLLRLHFGHIIGLTMIFHPELSQTGRMHIHGIVKFNNKTIIPEFYIALHNLKTGAAYEFDTIENLDSWKEYMLKQRPYMKSALAHLGLKYKLTH